MSTNTSQNMAAPIRITRTEAIEMLKRLQTTAGKSRTGRGKIFSAEWVAKGESGSNPYLCRKVVRFQVQKHINGGGLAFSPKDLGYMVVFEMVPQRRALKLYKGEAQHRLNDLAPQLESARQAAEQALLELEAATAAETEAQKALTGAASVQYKTAKARTEAEQPLKKTLREAASRFKTAKANGERALKTFEKVKAEAAAEQQKIDDPEAALTKGISARIERLKAKLAATHDAAEGRELTDKIAFEEQLLEQPFRSLTVRYRMLNLRGLRRLKIQGQAYEITTPSDPALPAPVDSK